MLPQNPQPDQQLRNPFSTHRSDVDRARRPARQETTVLPQRFNVFGERATWTTAFGHKLETTLTTNDYGADEVDLVIAVKKNVADDDKLVYIGCHQKIIFPHLPVVADAMSINMKEKSDGVFTITDEHSNPLSVYHMLQSIYLGKIPKLGEIRYTESNYKITINIYHMAHMYGGKGSLPFEAAAMELENFIAHGHYKAWQLMHTCLMFEDRRTLRRIEQSFMDKKIFREQMSERNNAWFAKLRYDYAEQLVDFLTAVCTNISDTINTF